MQLLGGATNARTHAPTEGGYAGPVMIEVMEKAAREKGVQILLETRATEILVDKDGKVTGVKATDKDGKEIELNSKAVVIATGGSSQ